MKREPFLLLMILLLLIAIAYTAGIATGRKAAPQRGETFRPVVFPKSKNGSATVLSPAEYCRLVGTCSEPPKTLREWTTFTPGKNLH